jgi:hypothetical protein
VNGVLIFGSIGEFYAFPAEEKIKAIKFAVERVVSRMKVIAGVSGTVYDDVLRMTKEATAAKADAVMAVSPYYFGSALLMMQCCVIFLALQKKLICLLFYITFLLFLPDFSVHCQIANRLRIFLSPKWADSTVNCFFTAAYGLTNVVITTTYLSANEY